MQKADSPWWTDYPFFAAHPDLAYFDYAATGQMPAPVLTAVTHFMTHANAPIHRGLYDLAYAATTAYEDARAQVTAAIGSTTDALVFTSGTTASLNLVATSFGPMVAVPGGEIIVSVAEHHSNLLPWQRLADATGTTVRVAPITATGAIDEDWVLAHITPQTRLVALAHETNVSGGVLQQAPAIAAAVHAVGGYFVLDGAQAMAHEAVDVTALDCDFYAFSGHKLGAPTGIGALYGRPELLAQMPPQMLGGGIVETVTATTATWLPAPQRFEAGSPNAQDAIGLAAALAYLVPRRAAMRDYCTALTRDLYAKLRAIPGVRLYSVPVATATVSLTLAGCHAHDLATWLNEAGVAVRAGFHCAEPLMRELGVPAVVRASLGPATTAADCDRLVTAVKDAAEFFQEGHHAD